MKTIAVDLDDVLSASVPGFVAYSNKRWGTTLTLDDYDEDCEQLSAQYLIDDQVKHCNTVAEGGITTLLYGDYAWSRNAEVHDRVKCVQNWQEVEEFFYGGNR